MGNIWGYEVEGIAQTDQQMNEWLANNKPSWGSNWAAGDVMYKDLNGDKKVNNGSATYDDPGDLRKIGNTTPRYRFGITLDAAWKGFDFLIFMQGLLKRDFWDSSPYSVGANVGLWQAAAFKDHLDYWRPANDTNFPPPTLSIRVRCLAAARRTSKPATAICKMPLTCASRTFSWVIRFLLHSFERLVPTECAFISRLKISAPSPR